MTRIRTLALALTMALSSAAWAAGDRVAMDKPMTSPQAGGHSMPGGAAGQPGSPAPSMGQGNPGNTMPMGMMPMQGSAGQQPSGSNMPMGSNPATPGSGGSMPMGMGMGMGMMPMQGGAGQQSGGSNMPMGSSPATPGSGGAMPMGMGMMPMQGGGSGQGGMSMPAGNSSGGMMMPMCGMPMMQGMMRGMSGSSMPPTASTTTGNADYLEGRLAFLKAELKLTNPQLPLWEAFAAAVRGNHQGATPAAAAGASTTQRLDADEQQQAARLHATRQLKGAVTPLYAALDDSQKRLFDQLSQHQLGLL